MASTLFFLSRQKIFRYKLSEMDSDFVERIRELCNRAGGQNALARRLGMSLGAVQRYLHGGEPTRQVLAKMCETCGVTLDWLVYGREADAKSSELESLSSASAALPLYGFAESAGQQGWYAEMRYQINAMLDCADPGAFAVVAPDRGMEPEGIRPGHVCVVSPNTRPQEGDAVFIRKTDGTAGLRKFLRAEPRWIHTVGWIAAETNAPPVMTREQLATAIIRQTGTVIFIRRRM